MSLAGPPPKADPTVDDWLGLGPDPIYQVPEGAPKPIGYVFVGKVEDAEGEFGYLEAAVHCGQAIFDELFARHSGGGRMPTAVQLFLKGEGEPWQDSVSADASSRCPLMSVSFKLTTMSLKET